MVTANRIHFQIIIFTIARVILNTAHRMVYPFLPVLARSVGVELTSMSYALTVRSLLGTLGPFAATASDRHGHKTGMMIGTALFTLGTAVVVFWPTFGGLATAICLSTFGKYIFDPSLQAYLSDHIPYERRGRALALTEFSWSFAFILGIPLVGFLIAKKGWLAPFPLLVILGGLIFTGLYWMLPAREPTTSYPRRRDQFKKIITSVPALMGLCIGLCMSAGNELVNLIFGAWLEDSFGLQIAALGAASAVIGLSELGGESLVAVFVDRLGKPRAVALGLAGNSLAALALPLLGHSEFGALIGLFFFYITFEFTLVSSLPLMTELVTSARATVMAFNIAAISLGRALGDLFGPQLYGLGFWFVILGAIGFNALALLALRILGNQAANTA